MTIRTRIMLVGLFVAAVALPVCQAGAADCGDLDAKITAAKTPAEHEAIAACYDTMAKAALAKSDEHKAMGAAYSKLAGAPVGKWNLPQHCEQLTKSYAAEAKMYAEMAAAHREMAKTAK